jgi:malate dehydrogenase (oxaloacetate-decarboxylating)
VCLAGLINALKQTNRRMEDCRAVILGAGAAGSAIARLLVDYGLKDVVLCDSKGAIYEGRAEGMDAWKRRWATITNRENLQGTYAEIMQGRDLFIGVSRPNMVTAEMIRSMAADPIVFALANPVSEISVHDALEAGAAVAMDGRGMNNALAFPGIFRGALDVRAKRITHAMKVAAAHEIAESAGEEMLPDMLDRDMHYRVAAKVAGAWEGRDGES